MPRQALTFRTRIISNRIPQVIARLQDNTRATVLQAAQDFRTTANQLAPRDTGSLASSIYVNDGESSDYGERVGAAQALNREVVILPEIAPEFVISLSGGDASTGVVVGVAASHGIFQEFGTRYMAAQPFMTPAVLRTEISFTNDMMHVADDL